MGGELGLALPVVLPLGWVAVASGQLPGTASQLLG